MNKNTAYIFVYSPVSLSQARIMDGLFEDLQIPASDRKLKLELPKLHDVPKEFCALVESALKVSQYLDGNIVFFSADSYISEIISSVKLTVASKTGAKVFLTSYMASLPPTSTAIEPEIDLIATSNEKVFDVLNALPKKSSRLVLIPSPASPSLREKISDNRFSARKNQLFKSSEEIVNILILVPNLGMDKDFYPTLIDQINQKSRQCKFFVLARTSEETKSIQDKLKKFNNATSIFCNTVDELQTQYKDIYQKEVISLEISNPQDALLTMSLPTEASGGAISLISGNKSPEDPDEPFLSQVSSFTVNNKATLSLWEKSEKSVSIGDIEIVDMFSEPHIRGLFLPADSGKAASFIWWCLKHGIFETMLSHGIYGRDKKPETGDFSAEVKSLTEV